MSKENSCTKSQKSDNESSFDHTGNLIKGSAWMTFGSLASRLMGALYIILWMEWMGTPEVANAANALFQVAYTPYGFFVNLSTAGIPSAISSQISHYNARQEYETGKAIYKRALQLMLLSGLVFGVLMYVLAPVFAEQSPTASTYDGVVVIRSLVPALLIIPVMSVTRGFFQGHNNMAPSALSQIIEQFARVIFMLASVYLVRQVFNGSPLLAVSLSTFAAFIGAFFSLIYLMWKMKTSGTILDREPSESLNEVEISTTELMKSIIITAIPFIFISTALTVSQFIDQFTFEPIMEMTSNYSAEDIQILYGISNANTIKIVVILVSIGTSMASTSIPLLSDLVTKGDHKEIERQFVNSIQLLLLVMIPATFGMGVLGEHLYAIFYGWNEFTALGGSLTQVSALFALIGALFILLANILKTTTPTRPMLWAIVIGLVVKLVLQYPAIDLLGVYGMITTSIIGFIVISFLLFYQMKKYYDYDINFLLKRVLLITLLAGVMAILVLLSRNLLMQIFPDQSRLFSVILVGLVAFFGILIYGYLILKTKLAENILGSRVTRFRKKLNIK